MKKTTIISYIHFLGCIGWSIFILIGLIVEPPRGEYILLFLVIPAALAITGSGIYLFIYGQNRLLLTKIVSYVNFLGCIGWSICGFCFLIMEQTPMDVLAFFAVFALFATTASGIYLFIIQFAIWRQGLARLWKVKKLTILWAGTFVIVAMCLFPPWVAESKIMGHAYLFSDGIFRRSYTTFFHAHIDLVRLIIQCAIVGLITGALLYTLNDKKAEGGGK